MNDDDLFDDTISLDDLAAEEPATTEIDKPSSGYISNPEFQKLLEGLKKELSNVDSFSFIMFSRTYSVILDHVQNMFSDLMAAGNSNIVMMHKILRTGAGGQYDARTKLHEYERCIVGTYYFLDIIGHITAHLKDNTKCADNDSYVSYVYRHVTREYAFGTLYLSYLIDRYTEACEQGGAPVDSNIVNDKIFSYITVIERQTYGEYLHAIEIENVGEMIDAVGQRDDFTAKIGTYIAQFVASMQEILDKIKNGDTEGLELEFQS